MKRFLLVLLVLTIVLSATTSWALPLTFTEKIRAQPGLVRYHVFGSSDTTGNFGDDIAFFTNGGQTNPTPAVLDTSIKASGQNSLKFTIPSQSSSGASGQWTMRFSANNSVLFGAGDTFYIQWQQKLDRYFFEHNYANAAGWKQAIIGEGDGSGCSSGSTTNCATSCSQLEVVPQNTDLKGFPQMYNSCPSGGELQNFSVGPIHGSDFDLQPRQGTNPAIGTYCSYDNVVNQSPHVYTNCYRYIDGLASGGDQVTQWGTFTVRIKLGTLSANRFQSSNVKAWVSWGGSTASKFIDFDANLVADGDKSNKFGRVWLLPYHSGKDATEVTNVSYTWYANVIVATQPIPLETSEVADTGTLATAAFAASARSWFQVVMNSTKSIPQTGTVDGNIFPYAMSFAWCEGIAYFVGSDHNTSSPGAFTWNSNTNNWTQLVAPSVNPNPPIEPLNGHNFGHLGIDCPNKRLWWKDYQGSVTPWTEYSAPVSTGLFVLVNNARSDISAQITNASIWWSGAHTGGGAEGSFISYNTAFTGRIVTYRPLSNDFAADILTGSTSDTYHGFFQYSPRGNVAVFGGGNANDTNMWRLNADHTVTQLTDAPVPTRIQKGNIVYEPVSGHFLILFGDSLYLLDETAQTGARPGVYTLLETRPSAYVGDLSTPVPADMASFAAPEYGVSCFVTGVGAADIRMGCYKYASSLAEGDISCTPSTLSFTAQPTSAVTGATLGTVSVAIKDAGGNTCSNATNSITLAENGSSTWGTLNSSSSLTKSPVSGVATWTDLNVTGATGSGSIDATTAGLTTATSNSITISAQQTVGSRTKLRLIR